jgi:hypothetical protein
MRECLICLANASPWTLVRNGNAVGVADGVKVAPRVGLEPTTYRLTAGRSTIELSGKAI